MIIKKGAKPSEVIDGLAPIPKEATKWDDLPASVRKALMGDARGNRSKLKRKLG